MRFRIVVGAIGFAALAGPASLLAQEREPLALSRLTGPVQLDGNPSEVAWKAIMPLPLTQYTPTFRGTPTQRTEIRVAYDDEHFYAAGWFYDSDLPRSGSTRCTAIAGTATTGT